MKTQRNESETTYACIHERFERRVTPFYVTFAAITKKNAEVTQADPVDEHSREILTSGLWISVRNCPKCVYCGETFVVTKGPPPPQKGGKDGESSRIELNRTSQQGESVPFRQLQFAFHPCTLPDLPHGNIPSSTERPASGVAPCADARPSACMPSASASRQ